MDVLILQEDQEYGWKVRMKAREYKSRRMRWQGPVTARYSGKRTQARGELSLFLGSLLQWPGPSAIDWRRHGRA